MKTQFFDRQDQSNPLNGRTISDSTELRTVLRSHDDRSPFFAELVGENGFKLLLGIGRGEGCVQFSSVDGATPYLMPVAPNAENRQGETFFLIGDTPTPVPKRYCLPLETVVDIADTFLQTGGRRPDVIWEEI